MTTLFTEVQLDRLDRVTSTRTWLTLTNDQMTNNRIPFVQSFDPVHILIILAIADHLEAGQGRMMAIAQVAKKLGLHPSTVAKHLSHLTERGWLVRSVEGRRTFYTLNPDVF